ncbi:MAG: NAD(P)H-dependent oxidoreductase, partial [Gammaproteobacteria bacterium]|nr:NAD(P)H-dependent oxidoreductase [Gammaproteobacteria bacterium]
TEKMANAVLHGARAEEIEDVEVRMLRAFDAGVDDLLWAEALILGTPENFGYMSGGMKDFLDRTFYPCEGKLEGMPYAIFVSANNDGTGAVNAMERIANGYAFRRIQQPLIARGEITAEHLQRCEELGLAVAAGLEIGAL